MRPDATNSAEWISPRPGRDNSLRPKARVGSDFQAAAGALLNSSPDCSMACIITAIIACSLFKYSKDYLTTEQYVNNKLIEIYLHQILHEDALQRKSYISVAATRWGYGRRRSPSNNLLSKPALTKAPSALPQH